MGTRGGRRRGAGRPPKSAGEHRLGQTTPRGKVLRPPAFELPPPTPVDPPADLSDAERHIWAGLAPRATEVGTLSPATAFHFRRVVAHLVLERRYADSVKDAGSPGHRGLIRLVDSELAGFGLAPDGLRSSTTPARPARDPLHAKYFADDDAS